MADSIRRTGSHEMGMGQRAAAGLDCVSQVPSGSVRGGASQGLSARRAQRAAPPAAGTGKTYNSIGPGPMGTQFLAPAHEAKQEFE